MDLSLKNKTTFISVIDYAIAENLAEEGVDIITILSSPLSVTINGILQRADADNLNII